MGGCSDAKAKVTIMVLKVDLDCCQCYKKVKKLLCKFPQIRDQVFDEKQNTVTITVVCCSPEKIRDKLCCKAGKSIKSIEIKEPKKPEPKPKPKPKPEPKPEPKPTLVPAPAPTETEKPKPPPTVDKPVPVPVPVPAPAPAPVPKPAPPAPKPAPPKAHEPEADQWVPVYPPCPPRQVFPEAVCCGSCYEGVPGGPCYQGYGPGYGYTYGRPQCPPGYYACRCDCFSEENPAVCSIM